ncbi:glycosyltransferase 61 family protein [Arenibaculum pallidiluteum]|uniref:glycosyltransferase 61 family protein n=1 Tax=Arenibaculum pallidiluteum TaxID=2812559 RepID=UPI001A96951B|nr:glycosyltransferase 61 family protein [Arenibaculum pallidiluteum]
MSDASIRQLKAEAVGAAAAGDQRTAAALYEHALQADPADAESLFGVGQLLLLAHEPGRAERWLRRGRAADPRSAAMAFLHGLGLWFLDRPAEAAEAMRAALAIAPGHRQAGLLLTRCLGRIGDGLGAAEAARRLFEIHGEDPALLTEVAADLMERDEDEIPAAVALLQRALTVAPDHSGALHNLGIAFARLGRLDGAQNRLEAAASGRPDAHASLAALAAVLLDRGDAAGAVDLARSLVASGSQLADAQRILGRAAMEAGDPAGAIAALEEASRLAPRDAATLSLLAGAYEAAGRIEEAVRCWRAAAALGPAGTARAALAPDRQPERRIRLYARAPAADEVILPALPLERLDGALVLEGGAVHHRLLLSGVALHGDTWQAVAGNGTSLDLASTFRTRDRDYYRAHGVDGQVLLSAEAPEVVDDEPTLFLGGTTNYYHWIIDDLPRLAAVESWDGAAGRPVLVNAGMAPFQIRMLELAGLDPERLKTPMSGCLTRYAELGVAVLPDRPRRPDGAPDWMAPHVTRPVLAWLRERFAPVMKPRRDLPGRIMILRGDASMRRCENEDEILDMARGRGFEPVRLETLSFDDQAALFAGAETVLAVHGAGCTNMAFSPPGATLIELHPRGHLPRFYCRLAGLLGQRHLAVPGDITRSLAPLPVAFWDFRIDPRALAPLLPR